MYEVNRIAIIKPEQPFSTGSTPCPSEQDEALTLTALRQDCNVLLIPPAEDFEDARDFIRTAGAACLKPNWPTGATMTPRMAESSPPICSSNGLTWKSTRC